LLHGHPQTAYMWRKLIAPLSEQYEVFAPDTRGCGQTDKPRIRITRDMLARDIIQFMDALGIEKARVVGHDYGGMIAYKMSVDYPDRIQQLVLMDTTTTTWVPWGVHGYWAKAEPSPEVFYEKCGQEYIEWLFAGKTPEYKDVDAPFGKDLLPGEHPSSWCEPEALAHYVDNFADPDVQFAAIQYYRSAIPLHKVIADPEAPNGERYEFLSEKQVADMWRHPGGLFAHPDWETPLEFGPEDRHKHYPGPALFIYSALMIPEAFEQGEPAEDHLPETYYTESIKRYYPDFRSRWINCGHFGPEEAPEQVLAHLQSFLAGEF